MSGPGEESDIADGTVTTMSGTEPVLLDIGDTLHNEADRPENNARDVPTRSKAWLIVLGDFWRVQDGDW
jgi:hypothetical protein